MTQKDFENKLKEKLNHTFSEQVIFNAKDASEICKCFSDVILESLAEGEVVPINKICKISILDRGCYNPATGTAMMTKTARFKPSSRIKELSKTI